MQKLITKNPEETFNLGKKLGQQLKKGDIVCLVGDLGAGKTAFSKGIGEGLEVVDYITSPTYTIINEYHGRLPLYHFDVYRLNGIEEMDELGYEEYFFGDGVVVVEWADLIKHIIPEHAIWITMKRTNIEDEREIETNIVGGDDHANTGY